MSDLHRTAIRGRNRRRLIYALLILVPYTLFGLQYFPFARAMAKPLGPDTLITAALAWFVVILLIFLSVEYLYIRRREAEDQHE